jgi:hypothetical protein
MKVKQVTTALLLLFVGLSVIFLVVKETRSRRENANMVGQTPRAQEPPSNVSLTENSAAREIPQANPQTPRAVPALSGARGRNQAGVQSRTVVAYYFHGNFRCQTCRKLEAFSREAVESGFPADLKAGRIEWHVINVEEPGNEHFVQDYQLVSKALVLVAKDGSKQTQWKNLRDIWTLVNNKEAFIKYVQTEIRSYLGEA